ERQRLRDHADAMPHCQRGASEGVGEPAQRRWKSAEFSERIDTDHCSIRRYRQVTFLHSRAELVWRHISGAIAEVENARGRRVGRKAIDLVGVTFEHDHFGKAQRSVRKAGEGLHVSLKKIR